MSAALLRQAWREGSVLALLHPSVCAGGKDCSIWECRWLLWASPGGGVGCCGQNASVARLGDIQAPDGMETVGKSIAVL